MRAFAHRAVLAFALAVVAACTTAPTREPEPRLSAEAVAEDFDAFLAFVRATHPDLEGGADLAALDAAAVAARQSMNAQMNAREAWMAMAVLNPYFGDAHTGLRRPVAAIEAYVAEGGRLFPAPVIFDRDGALRIAPDVAEGLDAAPGEEVLAINGVAAADIVGRLTSRMRGESPTLGRLIMARYFAEFFWTAYGGADRYVVRLRGEGGERTVTLHDAPRADTTARFRYQHLEGDAAYLDVPTFDIAHREAFAAFLDAAFADIQANGVHTLIIDLRENGGGAHDVSDLLLARLTDQPVASTSRITARVVEENVARLPGAALGSVVSVPFQQRFAPPANSPPRFEGEVYVLIGKLTYSQAIVFAATLQDHGLATLAGEETEGPANQTAQVQTHPLTNTGFEALAPIYVFTRASGETGRRGVVPEIPIEDAPGDPMHSVAALLVQIR